MGLREQYRHLANSPETSTSGLTHNGHFFARPEFTSRDTHQHKQKELTIVQQSDKLRESVTSNMYIVKRHAGVLHMMNLEIKILHTRREMWMTCDLKINNQFQDFTKRGRKSH